MSEAGRAPGRAFATIFGVDFSGARLAGRTTWVARLRELKTDDNLLLLRTYMEAGHAGAAGRFEKLHQVALVQAFVLMAHGALDRPVLPAV